MACTQDQKRRTFEQDAFQHMDALYSGALQLTRNKSDAEDLVQDTYLRAYVHFDRFEKGTNLKAWMFKILRNLFINRYNKKKNQGISVDLDTVEHRLEAPSAPHDITTLAGQDLEAALRQLPDDYRIAVVLAFVEGFSYREIASIMDCPIGTVMSRISRARRRLRELLGEETVPSTAFLRRSAGQQPQGWFAGKLAVAVRGGL